MLEKKYLVSGAMGLLLFFQLQVLSAVYSLLVQTGVMNGLIDTNHFLKGPLSMIPSIFMLYFAWGLVRSWRPVD